MNKIHRLIWNQVTQSWVAVAECARGRGKGSSRKLVAAALSLSTFAALGAPVGGQVTAGSGSVSQAGSTTTINQASPNLSMNWSSFNVAPTESVKFVQPSSSSVSVNRILDANGSQIMGRLSANGQVYLINPNGILFGQGAQINVGGLVASTLGMSDAQISSGARSFSGAAPGSVLNQGLINTTEGGYIALLGNTVSNTGTLNAPMGTVALGGGSSTTLTFANNRLVGMQIEQSVLSTLVANGGLIKADGGLVMLSAGAKDAALASVVNNTGHIQAQTANNTGGIITLLGGMAAGTTHVGGTLDASAPNGGDGGFIETSAAIVKIAEGVNITTAAALGKTGNWLIDPVDFTIAATGGNLTGAELGTLLTSNSVTIQTLAGTNTTSNLFSATAGLGDINVNDTVSWASNTLTLKADHNININAALKATGSGATAAKLALQYGQASTAGTGTDYLVKAPVNLSAGDNFSTKQGSGGTTKTFTVITQLGDVGSITGKDLQGINSTPGGNFALGQSIDAASSAAWNSSTGFISIPFFSGNFDGLGHTISNLIINRAGLDVGLFGGTLASATIQNIGVITSAVTGTTDVGTLVGNNAGTINNSYTASTVVGTLNAGGLVGINTGNINNSYAQSKVTLSGQAVDAATNGGGLVGSNAGSINNSYATGIINGTTSMGGLVGINEVGGKISNSNASGKVTATTSGGGLVGNNLGVIDNSFATTGAVYALTSSGGLIGSSSGQVTNSYATGAATGLTGVGGLIGLIAATPGTVSGSYAAGSATGETDSAGVGGLVGINNGAISDSYATGRVIGTTGVGGLIGNNAATASTSKSYASGVASGTTSIGGLIGINSTTNVTNSRWDTSANALGIATGDQGLGVQGLSPAAMKIKGNFTSWDFTSSSPMWYTDGTTAPILKALIKEFTVTATGNTVVKAYDGIAFSGGTVTYSNTAVESYLSGSLVFVTGTAQGAVDVGDYIIRPSGVTSTNPQYKVVFVDGKLSISRLASVAWVGNGASNNWFDPLNWANSAVPSKSNVENVVIPSTATVTFDNSKAAVNLAGAVSLVNINSAGPLGSLNMVSGSLNVDSQLQLANLAQTGGTISGSAHVTAGKSFSQTEGTLVVGGNINLTQALGDLVVTSLAGNNITLNANKSITLGNPSATGTPPVTAVTATGKLVLAFGQGAPATGNSSDYTVNGPIQLLAGGNFSTQLGLAGPVKEYTVITDLGIAADAITNTTVPVTTLQGMAASINVTKNFALGKDIPAQPTANWNSAEGFTPIGAVGASFTGSFDGLGHTINDLVISLPNTFANVGLIGIASGNTDIRNIGMVGGLVTGGAGTGGLVGSAASTNITNSYTTGNVYGGAWVGGLLGNNGSGNITNSYATGNVTGTTAVGGLVGNTLTGNFKNSYATGVVHGGAGSGGLVGINTAGNFDNTYATGNVDGFLTDGIVGAATNMGGLIGSSTTGNISYSHATGNVGTGNVPGSAGAPNMGGLLGSGTTGNISNSFATGNVNGSANIGGLVGVITTGAITESYAMGNVDGSSVIGGLVGSTTGNVMNSYASGRVKDIAGRGGLVGTTTVDIVNSYASGTSQGTTGGLVGTSGGVVTSSYWDITKGPKASIKGTQLTTDQMKIQANFPGWDFTNIWNSNGVAPPLLNNLYRFITVQAVANSVTKTYDGTPFQGGSVSYSDPNPNYLSGKLTFTGSSQGAVNVGNTYVITPGGLTSTNPQYILNYVSGNLTINRLATATWTGGDTDTNWFNSANWTNGVIPTLSNVANVNIPTGKTASFDVSKATTAQSGALNLDTLGSAGNLNLHSGVVNTAISMNLATFTQTGGTLGGSGYVVVDKFSQTGGTVSNLGDFTVNQAYAQSGAGTVAVGGHAAVTQAIGNLGVKNLSGSSIKLVSDQNM
ncbi:MAG: filamentous hemagglutinin N-terminal domain-containing protein, partial [Ilumatobacteraceae bacterium]|nr:filamentous hemagglutinin N-terminal domain-containing protein [Ilumatobacteraceae bacterium]